MAGDYITAPTTKVLDEERGNLVFVSHEASPGKDKGVAKYRCYGNNPHTHAVDGQTEEVVYRRYSVTLGLTGAHVTGILAVVEG